MAFGRSGAGRRTDGCRNVRLEAPQRLPTQLTIGVPLFWAVILAAPRSRRDLAHPGCRHGRRSCCSLHRPADLCGSRGRDLRLPERSVRWSSTVLAAADYVASTVAPYVGPVLLALATPRRAPARLYWVKHSVRLWLRGDIDPPRVAESPIRSGFPDHKSIDSDRRNRYTSEA